MTTNPLGGGGGVVLFSWDRRVWKYVGSAWSDVTPQWGMSVHNGAAAYDSDEDRVVYFGGQGEAYPLYPYSNYTWEWDGSVWEQLLANPVVARGEQAMAYDSARHKVVMFGGRDQSVYFINQTLLYEDENGWQPFSYPAPDPVRDDNSRAGHAMAYDAQCEQVIRFGGMRDDLLWQVPYFPPETWQWDGVAWDVASHTGPSGRLETAMAYDSARATVVLFGGWRTDYNGSVYLDTRFRDTWEWAVPPPEIVTPPQSQTVTVGQAVTLAVTADGPALSYRWFKDGDEISGATSASYTINSASVSDTGNYSVSVFDGTCTGTGVSSAPAHLAVCLPIAIVPPQDQTVYAPQAATFSIAAGGSAPLGFQWRHDGSPLGNFNNYLGSFSPTLTIDGTSRADTGIYDVVVTDACGTSAISSPAMLTVLSVTGGPVLNHVSPMRLPGTRRINGE